MALPEPAIKRMDEVPWRETDWDQLFADDLKLWAVIDGVSWPDVARQLARSDAKHACLYTTLDPDSRARAPWLVELGRFSAFTEALKRRLHGTNSYVLLRGHASFEEMKSHLRRFTMIRIPVGDDGPVYFRFYDPRVLIDAFETLSVSFKRRFMRIVKDVAVPISPLCLLPEAAVLTGPETDAFSSDAQCQGRLLLWSKAKEDPLSSDEGDGYGLGPRAVTLEEFTTLEGRMRIRSGNKLARALFAEFGDLTSRRRCEAIAAKAAQTAAIFGFSSVRQVQVFARAQLLFGHDFYQRHPKTTSFLYDPSLLEWQKKDRLEGWFDGMLERHGHISVQSPVVSWSDVQGERSGETWDVIPP